MPVSGWVQQTSITQREVSGGFGRGHRAAEAIIQRLPYLKERRFQQQGPTGTCQQPDIARRQRTEGQARVICAAVGWTYWTPPEDRGSG
ncbi:hypothetical protein DPMN_045564 [Dreissena polymorpha]|uniref:Uncharacterized protein n=1 Tax=Dreissena polymorpha TaxID=45954 RepID=A0A9D4D6S3_DREPO|nr:hypothetical protein DPMN_045564 [Dreissena polymorpha]